MNLEIPIEKKVNDSIHGFIGLSHSELEIIDTPIFQRLRRIKQVSPADFVFPGATHTRFSHCLGAMYIMDQILTHVRKDNQLLVQKIEDKQKLRLAALLHDIGHFPLSHTGENAVKQLCHMRHEDFGVELIKMFLKEKLQNYSVEEISALIKGDEPTSVYSQILSSKLDVDKLDYLMRDAYHAGVTYGQIDLHKLIRAMSFDKSNRMVFEKAGPALENMLVGRFHLYQVINQHHAVTAFEIMAERIYVGLMKSGLMPRPDTLLKAGEQLDLIVYDDNLLAKAMVEHLRTKEEGFLRELIQMYIGRVPLKVVWESSRLTNKRDIPKERLAVMNLVKDLENQKANLAEKIQNVVEEFTPDWLFPVNLKPIRIFPEDTPILVKKKEAGEPIPIENDDASLMKIVGEAAIYNTRIYTKPEFEEKIRPIVTQWAKAERIE